MNKKPGTSFALPLGLLSLALLVAAFNRLAPVTAQPLGDLPWVRWREMWALFALTPLLSLMLWDLKRRVGLAGVWELAFLAALLLLAISMGIHEPMNALSLAHQEVSPAVVETIRFWDDELSHYTFFIGFAACSLLLAFGQLERPLAVSESPWAMSVIIASSLLLAGIIFRNMAFEPTELDIATGLITLVGTIILWLRKPLPATRVPMVIYSTLGYTLGFGSALLWKALPI